MFIGTVSILLTLGFFTGFVSSTPFLETNAQRMARGLNPNPPQFLRNLRANKLLGDILPTPAVVAKRSQPSSSPPNTYIGRLQIRTQDDESLGNVRNWAGGGTISGINFGGGEDLQVQIRTSSPSGPFDILAINPSFPSPFFVGAGGDTLHNGAVLAAGNSSFVGFTNVEQTPPNSVPVASANGGLFQESAIWSIDLNTMELKAQWINSDKSKPPTILAYDIRSNTLFFVGDIDAHNKDNDTPASAVKIVLMTGDL